MNNLKAASPIAPFSLHWLVIGICALGLSGIYSIILAVAWHPSFKSIPLLATLFHRSLVAHVNLSITIWFLCGLFLCWSYRQSRSILPYFRHAAYGIMAVAIISMSAASLDPATTALMSNYIPALTNGLFALSLACIVTATLLQVSDYVVNRLISPVTQDFFTLGNDVSVAMVLVALGCFTASSILIDQDISGEMFYEILFWGGGHVLQFIWVHVLLLSWGAMLLYICSGFVLHRGYKFCLWLNFLTVLTAPIPYIMYDVTSADFRQLFTLLMSWVSGLAPVIFLVIAAYEIITKRIAWPVWRTPVGQALLWSIALFALGGGFAVMIDGINVKIPAHYHGSIVGVTIALMGFAYVLLQQHGYGFILRSRMALWQPALLGIGQIMHITGLFISGGYGVQRKSPLADSAAVDKAEYALRLMSTGGGIAIVGGLFFVIVMVRAFRKGKT